MRNMFPALPLVLVAVLLATSPAHAQPYPSKLIRLVTGSAPAGGSDLTARAIQPKLAAALGAQMIVENRAGVAGMLANEFVAKAAPDGYTLLLQPGSFVTVSTQLNSKTQWEPTKLLAAIIQVSAYDFVMVVHPSVPARNLKELVAVARAKPGALSFVSTGVGSNFHLAGELFKLKTKTDMLHVPYKGSAQALVDLVAGRAEVMFIHVPVVLQHIQSGRLRPLGVTGGQRNALLPDVPTIGEAVIKGYEVTGWEGIYAPAGTPRDVIARVNAAAAFVLATPELKEAWHAKAVEFHLNTPEAFAAKTRDEYEKNAALIKAAAIKPEL